MNQEGKILISGERGFVGNHLSKYLTKKGFDVIGLGDIHNSLDVTDSSQLSQIGDHIETVIHLAAKTSINESFRSPYDTYFTNIVGTLSLLEYARQRKVDKFIYLSTYTYGRALYLPLDENHPVSPHSPYNKSKLVAEQLCEYYSHDFGMNTVTLRAFYIYGPPPKPSSFLHCIMEQIMENNGKVVLSGERTKRDFLFIDDFCRLIENILMEFPRGYKLYNVGSGSSYTLEYVTRLLGRMLNKKISISYDKKMRTADVTDSVADISKVASEFNWRPSVSIQQGLQQVVDYYLMQVGLTRK